jgi:hypothetical protein
VGAEIGLREGDAEGGVGREVELRVALSPVFDYGDVYGSSSAGTVDVGHLDVCYTRRRERSKLQKGSGERRGVLVPGGVLFICRV